MAQIVVPQQTPPTKIERFLGINEDSSGDTQLELGESPNMTNFGLSENFKLKKREGYAELFESIGVYDIQGMWYGKLNGTFYFLFAVNGSVYKRVAEVNTVIGTLTDAKTFFFAFGDKVCMLNGTDYKSWDGATFQTVTGYIPLIATATPPTGGGVDNEQLNLLTGAKRQWFSGDGEATAYQLRELSVTSVDVVIVDGVTLVEGVGYTVNLTTGIVTFAVAPSKWVDNVSIQWTKGAGQRPEVTGYRFAMFYGGQNDTRVFFYGNGTNRYIYTGLADGVPSAEYLPALNYREVGSSEFAVTDIVRQYDRQIIYTNGGEAYYSYYDPFTDPATGAITIIDFPTYPLNDKVGNIATGQAQLILNNPFTIQNGVYEWGATNVRDERNVQYMSKRVQPSMDEEDLSTALTIDWEAKREYWVAIENRVWVYNYRLDAWYKFLLADNVNCFYIVDDELHFGTDNGEIMKFGPSSTDDNGTVISARWEMNFYDFQAEWLRKFLNRVWISLKPGSKERIDVMWQTDNDASTQSFPIEYNLFDYGNIDYADWSYLTFYNPQPFRLKIKAKKFVYFKLIITSDSLAASATVISINLLSRMGGEAK